jgi:hypothetical protein
MTKLKEREKENILAQTGRVRFLGMNIFNGTENLMSNLTYIPKVQNEC